MLKINLLSVSSQSVVKGLDEYEKRLSKYCQLRLINFYPSASKKTPLKKEETKQLWEKAVDFNFPVFILDEQGEAWSSKDLANRLAYWQQTERGISFLIGGADGLDKTFLNQKLVKGWLSLSKFTLPHQMAKLLFIEQIYRAFTILHHHPYHRS